MVLKTENFLKRRVINSKISIFLAITFSVLIMGILGALFISEAKIEKHLKESVTFNLVINNSIQELEIQQLIRHFSVDIDGVKSVKYISKEEAANTLAEDLGEDFLGILDDNPLSDIIEISFKSEYLDTANIVEKKQSFKGEYTEIDDVSYSEETLSWLKSILPKLRIIFLVITMLVFVTAVVLITSNIMLTIYARRFIIKTMQLVGATKNFIQKPFLLSSLKHSFLACLLGNLILIVSMFFLMDKVFQSQLLDFISIQELIYLVLTISTINIGVSFFSTWICVKMYLNLNTEQLYK
tara:strand:+ start:586 stop:1476 length:891 start_codon:yes stop_codon:yes gene_type:complete